MRKAVGGAALLWTSLALSSCIDPEPSIDERDADGVPSGQGPIGQTSPNLGSGGGAVSSGSAAGASSGASTGSASGASSGGAACTPSSSATACTACIEVQCCAQETACVQNGPCTDLVNCEANCAADTACTSGCQAQHSDGLTLLNATLACATTNCPVCASGDGGTSSGSSSGSSSPGGSGSSSGVGATSCATTADCSDGQICCGTFDTNNNPVLACQSGPCPVVPVFGRPIELCASSSECFVPGDVCMPWSVGTAQPLTICQKADGGA